MVICLEQGADLHMAQLMPLLLTVSCFTKLQMGFTFLVPAHPGSPGQRAVKRVCVCKLAIRNRLHTMLLKRFPPQYWFHTTTGIWIGSSTAYSSDQQIHTCRSCYKGNSRPYLMLCTAMQPLKNKNQVQKWQSYCQKKCYSYSDSQCIPTRLTQYNISMPPVKWHGMA